MKKTIPPFLAGILALFLFIFLIVLAISFRPKESAGTEIATLEERLSKLGLPVKHVSITSQTPLQCEVILDSTSNTGELNHEDLWNRFLTERELDLAYLNLGIPIDIYRIVVEKDKGDHLYDSEVFLNSDLPSQNLEPVSESLLDNVKTSEVVVQNLNLQGLKLLSLDIPSSYTAITGNQMLVIELSTSSENQKSASDQINPFISNLIPQINSINSKYGTRLVIVRAEIKDPAGSLLVDYMADVELGKQSSWVAEGIQGAWFSQTAPIVTPEFIPTSQPVLTATATTSSTAPFSVTPYPYPTP